VNTTLRLRAGQLKKLRTVSGITTDAALAARMGMDPATVSRVLSGRAAPGPKFMAALVSCFPGWDLDDLFEVIEGDDAA